MLTIMAGVCVCEEIEASVRVLLLVGERSGINEAEVDEGGSNEDK